MYMSHKLSESLAASLHVHAACAVPHQLTLLPNSRPPMLRRLRPPIGPWSPLHCPDRTMEKPAAQAGTCSGGLSSCRLVPLCFLLRFCLLRGVALRADKIPSGL